MIDGSVLQSAQKCFEKKSRVVVKMVVTNEVLKFRWKTCIHFTAIRQTVDSFVKDSSEMYKNV